MSALPSPPQQISGDGQEIWDWAERMSDAMARRHRIAELSSAIAKNGTRCGDCDKWMKSSECPAERNVNGMSRGPSCEAYKCGQFVQNTWSAKLGAELQEQLNALRATTQDKETPK